MLALCGWRRASAPEGTPEALKDKMALWQLRAPWHVDAPRVDALFPAASYQYVWLGMNGHRMATSCDIAPKVSPQAMQNLDRSLHDVREKTRRLSQAMPGNRALLNALTSAQPTANTPLRNVAAP